MVLVDADLITYRAGFGSKGDFLLAVDITDSWLMEFEDRFGKDMRVFLSGPTNFRNSVATLQPYKGNRNPLHKPVHYKAIREYMINFWKAEVTDGIEADDIIGLTYDSDTIIASIDKDLKQLPNSTHYDFVKKEVFFIDEEEAWFNFYLQLLTGDLSDNIPGQRNPSKSHHKNPPNFTKNTATKFLSMTGNQLEAVKDVFRTNHGKNWEKVFDEIATLLWIQRKDRVTHNLL